MAEATASHRAGLVAIVGRPSVGKSTLLNALVGAKVSITSKKPQTTRHRIAGIVMRPDAQVVFVDTPGFQTKHRSVLNERMNRTVRESLGDIDAIVWVVDGNRVTAADRAVLDLAPASVPVVAALNKIDTIPDKSMLLPRLQEVAGLRAFAAIVPVSAERRVQLDALLAEVIKLLPEGPALYPEDDVTDRDERFLAAELVREKIFRLLGDELPYATTVGVDSFAQEGRLRHIHATVYVEKASQRAIVLGEGGSRMKAIAAEARTDMERLFGGPVYLEVWVRVKRGWAQSEASLKRMGY